MMDKGSKPLDPEVRAAVKDLFMASDVFRQAYSDFLRGRGADAHFRLEEAQARLDEARLKAAEAELHARAIRPE
ncbi:MAG: hypothetical protein QOE90_2856 [Thermoplasmata archaeon]|jgi:hypothetical protein|nr:hypothetical protein [Thermoplasmata archaeon]